MERYIAPWLIDTDPLSARLYRMLPTDFFLRTDPSECVGSHLVIPTLKQHFEDMDLKYFHGSIVQYSLDEKFYEAFDPANKTHRAVLHMLFDLAATLIAAGEIPSVNAHMD